jgi:hypothetical protein
LFFAAVHACNAHGGTHAGIGLDYLLHSCKHGCVPFVLLVYGRLNRMCSATPYDGIDPRP